MRVHWATVCVCVCVCVCDTLLAFLQQNFNMLSKAYAQVTRASVKVQACADASEEGVAKRARPEDKTPQIQISDDDDADNDAVNVAFEAPKAVVLQI